MVKTLQDEIKQTRPFTSPAAEALLGILRTAAVIEHRLAEALKPHGLTPTQYNVLRILRGSGDSGLCGREVGERMVAKVPDVPRLLERLEAMELIRRQRDRKDRRHVTARITERGLALLEEATPDLHQHEVDTVGCLDAAALAQLSASLAAIRAGG